MIRILGIAPYEGLKYLMDTIQKDYNDIELDVFVGDLEEGLSIALSHMNNGYDMILSRGGTFQLISQVATIPVLEVPLSIYDILRSIRIADGLNQSYAIMGFPNITSSAHQLCDLMNYPYPIYTIHDSSEVDTCISTIKNKGHQLILCDRISGNMAGKIGLNTILITSGTESVQAAFQECRKIYTIEKQFYQKTEFLKILNSNSPYETIVFDKEDRICFSSLTKQNESTYLTFIRKQIPKTKEQQHYKTICSINNSQIFLEGKLLMVDNIAYTVFYISLSETPIYSVQDGISYQNKDDILDNFYQSFYRITNSETDISSTVSAYTHSPLPVLICGENGTGKDEMAQIIYARSDMQNAPFVEIDFAILSSRAWKQLFTLTNSPFQHNGNTIYFKNMQQLSDAQYTQLYSYMSDSYLSRRNRLLFSYNVENESSLSANGLHLLNHLAPLVLSLHPLRENRENIPTLVSLYISHLNDSLGREIVGFDPQAMELMQSYHWPTNYLQFKRILTALATVTTSPYIRSNAVKDILTQENGLTHNISQPISISDTIYTTKTLAELNYEIALSALNQNNGNQSKTATQLGISRTTLWRLLKRS